LGRFAYLRRPRPQTAQRPSAVDGRTKGGGEKGAALGFAVVFGPVNSRTMPKPQDQERSRSSQGGNGRPEVLHCVHFRPHGHLTSYSYHSKNHTISFSYSLSPLGESCFQFI